MWIAGRSVSGEEVEECDVSVETNVGKDEEINMERVPAIFSARAEEEAYWRQARMMTVREAAEQVSSMRLAEELWKILVLERRFEAFRRL